MRAVGSLSMNRHVALDALGLRLEWQGLEATGEDLLHFFSFIYISRHSLLNTSGSQYQLCPYLLTYFSALSITMISLFNLGEAPRREDNRQVPYHSRFFPPHKQTSIDIASSRASNAMDFSLRCNSLKCRAQLTDRAVVTTCRFVPSSSCSPHMPIS